MDYFWYHRPEASFPPPSVARPEDVTTMDRLAVFCTQTRLRPADQRKLVLQWCQMLPTLAEVRFLWLLSKVPQSLFDAACRMPSLKGLYIKWSGLETIDALDGAAALRYFHLGSSSRLRSIDSLARQCQLKWLGLENLKLIRDFEAVGRLVELEGLTIEGSMSTTQRVSTLTPIGKLRNLRYLSLDNVRSDDATLTPLFSLHALETFIFSPWWDEKELAELRRRNPKLTA
jgi:hypothetical protein